MGTRWLMPALCAVSVFLSSGCGDSNSPSDGNPPPDGDILVRNNFFDPATFQVTTGTQVTWAWNSGGQSHSVTFTDANSGVKTSGTFSRTFTTAGAFAYHCEVHPTTMTGTITVTEAAGGADAPPTGGGGGGMGGGSGGGYPGY